MKKLVIASALLLCISCANGQKSIDRLFEKYSDREGFTCVTLSGNLLNFSAILSDDDDEDNREIKARITEVRVLAEKDDHFDEINFHDLVRRDLDISGYEELMRVKEYDQDLRVLVRQAGKRISELLLVTGGDDNAIVQIKGDMSVSDARYLCEKTRKNHCTITF